MASRLPNGASRPGTAPREPKLAQEGLRKGPRRTGGEDPSTAQDGPKTANPVDGTQGRKTAQEGPKGAPGELKGAPRQYQAGRNELHEGSTINADERCRM